MMKGRFWLVHLVTPVRAPAVTFAVALLFTMTLGFKPAQGASLPIVEMVPGIHNVEIGDGSFSATIQVRDLVHHGAITYDTNRDTTPDLSVPSIGLGSFELSIHYNRDVLRVQGVEPGPDLGKTGRTFSCLKSDDVEHQVFKYACVSSGSQEGLQGDAVLARFEFMPTAAGTSFLELGGQLSGPYSDDIPVDIKGAAVIVDPPGPIATSQQFVSTPGDIDGDGTPDASDDSDGDGTPDSVDSLPFGDATPVPGTPRDGSTEGDPRFVGAVETPPGDDGGQNTNSSDGGDGNSFTTTLLIALGVIAGAVVLGAAGFSAWRLRRSG